MDNLRLFLSHWLTTASAIVTIVSGFIAVMAKIKDKKKLLIAMSLIFLASLAVAIFTATEQSTTSQAVPTSTSASVESTQPDLVAPSEDSIAPSNNEDNVSSILKENSNTIAQENSNANSSEDSGTTQNSGNNSNVATVTGDSNTIVQGENNTIISGNNNAIAPASTETPVTVSSIVLDKERATLAVNDTLTLTATVLYSNNEKDSAVVWISSDTTVARVDKAGNVTALAPGIAKIIAQSTRNNSAKAAECEIQVIAAPSGYSISLSTDTATLFSTFRIYITPYEEDITRIQVHAKAPSGHVDTFVWEKDKQYYIETETGTWTIWATIENAAGVYEGSQPSDFVTIEIIPLSFDSFLT